MSRKIIVISTLFILLCTVLASCGNNISTVETYEISNERSLEAAKGSLDKDGSYTVKKGDLYIGINYGFEDGEYWELMTVIPILKHHVVKPSGVASTASSGNI